MRSDTNYRVNHTSCFSAPVAAIFLPDKARIISRSSFSLFVYLLFPLGLPYIFLFFFFNDPPPPEISPLPLPDALPISGLLEEEAARGNEAWLPAVRLGRPFVLWKYAATLDGRIAAADGTSRWITSAEARAEIGRAHV